MRGNRQPTLRCAIRIKKLAAVIFLTLSHGKPPLVSSLRPKMQHGNANPSRSIAVAHPHASALQGLRGRVLEKASISLDLEFRSPNFSRRVLGNVVLARSLGLSQHFWKKQLRGQPIVPLHDKRSASSYSDTTDIVRDSSNGKCKLIKISDRTQAGCTSDG